MITSISRALHSIRSHLHPHSFEREVLRHGFLDRYARPQEWFDYRVALNRIHAPARAIEGGLATRPASDLFPGLEAVETKLTCRSHTPYNISLQELLLISSITQLLRPSAVFEFGTYDGRTTLHLAMNAPKGTTVYTLDVQSGAFDFGGDSERIERTRVGEAFLGTPYQEGIVMLTGDSRTMDLSKHFGAIDLVFVDADHSYGATLSDSRLAFEMAKPGAVILWHDYLMIEGVTRALVELSTSHELVQIAGTTLAAAKMR